jgi:catalase
MESPITIMERLTGIKEAPKPGVIGEAVEKIKTVAAEKLAPGAPGAAVLTSNFGIPPGDATHSLNIAGHPVSSDTFLFEKQQTFNRSKIVERMVHACGSGAFGHFEVTKDMSRYTKAKFLDSVGKRTPVMVRFSTVTLGREFPDSARNPRGFAIKFYTEEGNYDILGLNFPVFFVRDPIQGPDVIRSQMKNSENFLLNFDSMFDFISLVPESMHAATMMFSDHGTPVGWRFLNGFGCHTFKWVNAAGEAHYIKYHFVSENGTKNFAMEEATRMCGEDPDFAKRDLWEHIHNGGEATWRMCVQIMPEADAQTYQFDPFDNTKVWYHKDYPLMEFGRLVLNRNPENFHRDVEQVAFSPGSLVPGIEPSPDALLQFRMFLYRDAQFHRLGANLHQIPVNCPFRTVNYHPQGRDGKQRVDSNGAFAGQSEPYYHPNSMGGPSIDLRYNWLPEKITGQLGRLSYTRHEASPDDDYKQVRELFLRVMKDQDREHLFKNIAGMIKFARREVQLRFMMSCYKVHPSYAMGVAQKLGTIPFEEVERNAKGVVAVTDRSRGYAPMVPAV